MLIRDVVGARPKYGDESARPAYWPDDVPWKKGKSISQVVAGSAKPSPPTATPSLILSLILALLR